MSGVSFHVPSGPMNLASLFPGVDFTNVDEYYLELKDQADDSVILTTNHFEKGCCCNDDTIRIFFVQQSGGIDAANFRLVLKEREVSSGQWEKPLKYPLEKWDGGTQRFNVKSIEMVTCENNCYSEADQPWLMQLVESPNTWIQWLGTQGQDNDYLPIVIKDGRFGVRKRDQRYEYVLQIQFAFANAKIIHRN